MDHVQTFVVQAGTTPTRLDRDYATFFGGADPDIRDEMELEFVNDSAVTTVHVGGSDVTTVHGQAIAPGGKFKASLRMGPKRTAGQSHFYAVVAAGTAACRCLQAAV